MAVIIAWQLVTKEGDIQHGKHGLLQDVVSCCKDEGGGTSLTSRIAARTSHYLNDLPTDAAPLLYTA